MKSLKLILGLTLLTFSLTSAVDDKGPQVPVTNIQKKSVLNKFFTTKEGFFYGTVSLAATIQLGLQVFFLHRNIGDRTLSLQEKTISAMSNAAGIMVCSYVALKAYKDIQQS